MTWYLVMVATGMYVGPIDHDRCVLVEGVLASQGIVCAQATVVTVCPVPGRPEISITCPIFEFPRITVKP